jgi:uncharacterized membrane protein SpoIIM required for sporulation
MVLESLINPNLTIKKSLALGGVGFLYAIIAGIVAYVMFEPYASIVMVFLTVIACAPFMYALVQREGETDVSLKNERSFLTEYGIVTKGLVILFVGITLGYLTLFLTAPQAVQSHMFDAQQSTITAINGRVTVSGMFFDIFTNNMQVLAISILFSLLYGIGAITIILWNSSVIATALGNFMHLHQTQVTFGGAFLWGITRYFIHGIPEMAGYMVAGLAGGILSVAIMHYGWGTKQSKKVMWDALQLIVLAALLIFIGALIESTITPMLYRLT